MSLGQGRGQASSLVTEKPKWPSRLPVKEAEVTEEEPSALSLLCESRSCLLSNANLINQGLMNLILSLLCHQDRST